MFKKSGLFSFYALPSGGKSKDVVAHGPYLYFNTSLRYKQTCDLGIYMLVTIVNFINLFNLGVYISQLLIKSFERMLFVLTQGPDPIKKFSVNLTICSF